MNVTLTLTDLTPDQAKSIMEYTQRDADNGLDLNVVSEQTWEHIRNGEKLQAIKSLGKDVPGSNIIQRKKWVENIPALCMVFKLGRDYTTLRHQYERAQLLESTPLSFLYAWGQKDRTPRQWCDLLNVVIVDNDGFDDLNKPVGLLEFVQKLAKCTTRPA